IYAGDGSCRMHGAFQRQLSPLLKCIQRFTLLLPDAAVPVVDDLRTRRPGTRKLRLTQVAAVSSGTRIVICGGGAIGAAIAYFTSRRGARCSK
ncbi:MAG: hypothetical protein WA728_01385, partial [Xanthobacteraceae bacterium]